MTTALLPRQFLQISDVDVGYDGNSAKTALLMGLDVEYCGNRCWRDLLIRKNPELSGGQNLAPGLLERVAQGTHSNA